MASRPVKPRRQLRRTRTSPHAQKLAPAASLRAKPGESKGSTRMRPAASPVQPGMMGAEPPSLSTTRIMVLLGLIFQLIFSLFFFLVVGVLGVIAATAAGLGLVVFIVPLILLIFFGLIPLFLLYVAYAFVYKRIRDRQYEAAKGPLLVLAILEIIIGGVLPGIFYIIGYVKLGDVINETRQMSMGPPGGWAPGYGQQPPMAQPYAPMGAPTAPYPSPPGTPPAAAPMAAPAPAAAPAPNCPRCSRPATFVPQYNRYYCYSCAQYV